MAVKTVRHRIGTLSFVGASGGKTYHVCKETHTTGNAARPGRWRVAIAGWPLRDDHGDQIRICEHCRKRLSALWAEFAGLEVAA